MGGAADGSNVATDNIEILTAYSNTWSDYFTRLPKNIWQQCTVMVNATTMLVMGGEYTSETFFHTLGTYDWINGPSMMNPRQARQDRLVGEHSNFERYVPIKNFFCTILKN
jgi:hypothetical protein